MTVEIITPKGVLIRKKDVNSVSAPGVLGDFGVLKNHVSFVTMLREGLISMVSEDRTETRVRINEAVFEVLNNKIVVLAEFGEIAE